jgi:hypothetical protein
MNEVEDLLREEAHRLHAEWPVDYVIQEAAKRSRSRRTVAGVVGLAGLAVVIIALVALGSTPTVSPPASSTLPSPAQPGSCDYGPWLEECPEADWVRATLLAADLPVSEETAAAFVVRHPGGELLFWASDPANHAGVAPLAEALRSSTLTFEANLEGVPVYRGDGEWVWSVHGLNVWVADYSGESPSLDILAKLVAASESVPYSP